MKGVVNLTLLVEEADWNIQFPISITVDVEDINIFKPDASVDGLSPKLVVKYLLDKLSGN